MVYAVRQLFEALRYKPEGCGFHFRLGHRGFFTDLILPALGWTQSLIG
jgi:hypothetical protein